MVDNIKEAGLKITWIVWEFIHGKMVDAIWENITMIKNMVTVYTNGMTGDYT